MAELFIPPEGAMQFEVLRDRFGNKAPEGTIIWVVPSAARYCPPEPCPHKHGYEIIMESVPHIMRSRSGMKRAGICECWGRIIE